MTTLGPVLYVLGFWWAGTGLILYLDGLPRRTFGWSFFFCSVLLAVALCGLAATRDDDRVTGAYLAFTCAMLVWSWQEMGFLMGFLTGPRNRACPAGARGWQRAGYAVLAILYHELVLLGLGVLVVVLTRGGSNALAAWTFGTLWLMRLSAKLNVFLGVRNLAESFLPDHLRWLGSYFRRRTMNALFPLSVLFTAALAAWVWAGGLAGNTPDDFDEAATAFVGTLLTLALLEHVLMMLPIGPEALWRSVLRRRGVANRGA